MKRRHVRIQTDAVFVRNKYLCLWRNYAYSRVLHKGKAVFLYFPFRDRKLGNVRDCFKKSTIEAALSEKQMIRDKSIVWISIVTFLRFNIYKLRIKKRRNICTDLYKSH